MVERLKVLHVASWYPSEVHASLGNFVERHVEAVAKVCDVEVWAPVAAKGAAATVQKMKAADGTTDRSGEGRRFLVKKLYHEATKPHLLGVARVVASEAVRMDWKPDVVHVHVAYPAGAAAVAWAKKWGVPVVLTEHWTAYHAPSNWPWWRRRAIKDVVKGVNAVCPVTADLGQAMVRWVGPLGIHVVPNVVDTERFAPAPPQTLAGVVVGESRRKLAGAKANRLLHVSSLDDSQKNVRGLLHAVAAACTSLPDLRLTVVGGERADVAPYQNLARELGIADRVTFRGVLATEDVAAEMRVHDVLVLNSRRENFPCVIPEAWSTGMPVMSTDVGGIREHLPEGLSARGYLLPAGADNAAWVDALKQVHNATWDRETIREHAVATFGMEAVGRAYLQVYDAVMNATSPKP